MKGTPLHPQHFLQQPGEDWSFDTHYVCISSLEDAKRLFGTSDITARQQKSSVFYQGIEARQRLSQGMHDRCEEFVFAAGEKPSERDLAGLAHHLPLHFKVIREPFHRVAAGEVWDLSVDRIVHWPELDHLEELYVFLHIDHLVLEEGAHIIIRGNVLAVECGVLERAVTITNEKPVSADYFDFGILATPGSVDRNVSKNTGKRGENGIMGSDGVDGSSVQIEGSLFGPYIANTCTDGASSFNSHGQDGNNGKNGDNGRHGRNGGMCRLADIRIRRMLGFKNNPLRLFSQAGDGNPGGDGGSGGDGGRGGNGGKGAIAVNGRIPFGNGGNGGRGGFGGKGGNGGNGGISSNIFVELSPEDCIHFQYCSLSSIGGVAGEGGCGGLACTGGKGCVALDHADDGRDGLFGQVGSAGIAGTLGKSRPGAKIFAIPTK